MKEPILISIPHGGWKIAPEIQNVWALSLYDAFYDGDPFTAHIYDFSDRVNAQIIMEYYRACVDLNRSPDDMPPENPDGVIKSHTCYNVEVYKKGYLPDKRVKKLLLDTYYFPYHDFLDKQIGHAHIKMGVDCHSMAAVCPPISTRESKARPLICLGNLGNAQGNECEPFKRITCPTDMIRFMADEFTKVFQHEEVDLEVPASVALNIPFSGGYITQRVGRGHTPFVQIELSRALYLTTPYFNQDTLEVAQKRIKDLNQKIWAVLQKTVANL